MKYRPPVATAAPDHNAAVVRQLLDVIAGGEASHKGYDSVFGDGTDEVYAVPSMPVPQMTMAQMDDFQDQMLANSKSRRKTSAAGRYQITKTTRNDLLRGMAVQDGQLYDAQFQEVLAGRLLRRRGLDAFIAGKISGEKLQNALADEWQAIPKYGAPDGDRLVKTSQIQDVLSRFQRQGR
jgi:muramidase (phage lysozyme)